MEGLAGYRGDVLLVANPISGGGRARRWADRVTAGLRELGLSPHVVMTSKSGDAREAARGFTGGMVLVFGGDGTLNEVLNGVDIERCILGVIPAGTGNVLGKELGLLARPMDVMELLRGGRVERLDLGVCNGRRFVCMVGAGTDAYAVKATHEGRTGYLSQLHYVPVVTREVLCPHDWDISAAIDGTPFIKGATFLCIGNTHSYGGPIEMTPAACPADGALDIMGGRARDMVDFVRPALALQFRRLHVAGSVLYGRGRRFRLTSPRADVPWQADGDLGGVLPADVHCEPARVRVIVPHGWRPSIGRLS